MKIRSRSEKFETAIDKDILRERFQGKLMDFRHQGSRIAELFITRVFPGKGNSLNIQYELYLEKPDSSETEKVILGGHLLGPGEPLPEYLDRSGADYILLEDIGLIIPIFPFDPRLKSLRKLTRVNKGSAIQMIMDEIFNLDIKEIEFEVLGYRPGKRCVFRYLINGKDEEPDGLTVVAKVFRVSGFEKALVLSSRLESEGFDRGSPDGITVPRILMSDRDLGAIFMEDAPGISLHFLANKAIFTDACSASGRTLRKLHNLDPGDLKIYTEGNELGNLKGLGELISNMYPEFGERFDRELKNLTNHTPVRTGTPVFSHRDFFDKQVIYSETRCTLLDYGNAALADPALDVGNFIAHLVLRKLQQPDCRANIEKGIVSFVESYGKFEWPADGRTEWWIRASLLRLFGLYLLRPRWRNMAADLLTESLNSLEGQ